MTRWNATPHDCLWCGASFVAHDMAGKARFCCKEHKMAFNNLRQARAVQLYDLFMANAFERTTKARRTGTLRRAMDRLAARWRDEDHRARDGRQSWGDWAAFLANDPTLTMTGTYGSPWTAGRGVRRPSAGTSLNVSKVAA